MLRNCFPFLLAIIFIACETVHHVQPKPRQTAIPTLTAFTDTGSLALRIVRLNVTVQTTGNLAQTIFELTFYNNTDRVLEGEFDFPLLDGQNIFRYGLEVNGEMREGVVVEKTTARVAYENTVRRGIDPGLVEKTKGNNFRTRIYPIPAKGYKKVLIGVEEMLGMTGKGYLYSLPLYTKDIIDTFALSAVVKGSSADPVTEGNELLPFQFAKGGEDYSGKFSKQKFPLNHLFTFLLPFDASSAPITLTEKSGETTYCYVNSFIAAAAREKQKPSTIAVLWDISSSATGRNEEKEKKLLKQYLEDLENVKLLFIPFHIAPQSPVAFEIKNGDAEELIKSLDKLDKEGGTQLGAIDLTSYNADEFLLFSDGISTFGKKEIRFGNKPVVAVNSSVKADLSYLKFLALKTGGSFIDLVKDEPATAIAQMHQSNIHVVKTEVSEGSIADLVIRPVFNSHNLSLACVLNSPKAIVDVYLGYDENNIVDHKQFVLAFDKNNAVNVKRIWASLKIEELELEFEKNKDEITSLGKTFSIVTRNTSLLVLDRIEDYLEYEIVPPPAMQKEYYALLKEKKAEELDQKKDALDEALAAMDKLKKWWKQDYRPQLVKKNELVTANAGYYGNTGSFALDSASVQEERQYAPPATYSMSITPGVATTNLAYADLDLKSDKNKDLDFFDASTEPERKSEIEIKEWTPDVEWLKKISAAKKEDRFDVYRQLKKQDGDQPAFFADMASYFFNNGDKATALLILSNIAEMKLEDPELLRIMGYKLMEMGENEIAVETFKDVKEMREEEPQSYRDLSIAYNEAGKYSEALHELNEVLKGTWDERFGEVKAIALSELNAIISAHSGLNVSAIDRRLIFAMPVDVRIVIGWSANNSDIDLWVTDPNNEKCFYSNKETSTGGKISDDVTQGYGPEEFMVKKAVNGNYVVEANLFGDHRQTVGGPLTITAELFTDFGRPTQKRRTINFRVTEAKDVVKIGELTF